MERIEAELLIPGSGEPVSDGVVIIDDSVISYAGPAGQAPATSGAVVHRAETVMPGIWDVLTVAANPLADIAALGRPDQITGAWAKGRRVAG